LRIIAIVVAGDRFDKHSNDPMGSRAMVDRVRTGRPFELELTNRAAQPFAIQETFRSHFRGGETCLVRQKMRDRHIFLSMRLESGNVLRDPVGKAKFPFLDQRPDRRGGNDLGVREERKESLLIDRSHGVDDRAAEATIERELAVPRYSKLSAWMETAGDMGTNDLACALEFRGIETDGFRTCERNQRGFCHCEHG
jgi:hypothetical protein